MSQYAFLQIEQLTATGFGAFAQERCWDFGKTTTVTGHNYQGKSTIADAIAYAITGSSYFGGRDLDRLQNNESSSMMVEVAVRTDDFQLHKIRRMRQNGTTTLSVDGTTTTQERFAERFGSKDLILSMLNPLYFAEVLGSSGRKLIEQYLPAVPHSAVMDKLSEHMRKIIGDDMVGTPEVYLKNLKNTLKELEKDRLVLYGQMQQTEAQRAKLDKELADKKALLAHISAALQPLSQKNAVAQEHSDLNEQIGQLGKQYAAIKEEDSKERCKQLRAALLETAKREYLSPHSEQLHRMQEYLQVIYSRYTEDVSKQSALQKEKYCPMCLRLIDEASIPQIQSAFAKRIRATQLEGTALRQKCEMLSAQEAQQKKQFEAWKQGEIVRLEHELTAMLENDADQKRAEVNANIKGLSAKLAVCGLTEEEATQYWTLSRERNNLEIVIEQITGMLDDLPKGQVEALEKLDSEINNLHEKIEAAKAYQFERASLLFAPVKMRKASLKLYETRKESGEIYEVFKLCYDGRDYVQLSLSERVRCGIEVVELLSALAGKNYPLFVDNTESICDLGAALHSGQLILSRVMPNQTLCVQILEQIQQKAG